MLLATFNVDNLFDRPRVFGAPGHEDYKPILESYARISALLAEPSYEPATKDGIVKELVALGLSRSDESPYAILRQNHGRLIKRGRDGSVEVVAAGRDAWAGSIELRTYLLPEPAVQNTGRVIGDVAADVQAVVEVESRSVLEAFANRMVKPQDDGKRFEHAMVVEGNDERPINVGVLCRHGWEIAGICSHVDDKADGHKVFSRDCPVYTLRNSSGAELVLLVNHFKSQGYGSESDNDAKRELQAARVAEIYARLREEGHDNVAVVGDLNDVPGSDPLHPLLQPATDLCDVMDCKTFDDGTAAGDGHMHGTYDEGRKQFDYLLLSPSLFARVRRAGIYRKGTLTKRSEWEMYPTMHDSPQNAASDHALVYADIDI